MDDFRDCGAWRIGGGEPVGRTTSLSCRACNGIHSAHCLACDGSGIVVVRPPRADWATLAELIAAVRDIRDA